MDWADKLAEKIGERCPYMSYPELDFVADAIRERVQPLVVAAKKAVSTSMLSALELEVKGFNEDAFLDSQGDWVFERSSGYAGFRCTRCSTWRYANDAKRCNCDK